MKAIGFKQSLPADNASALEDLELDAPIMRERDLLVRVRAVSVNPVDTKMRLRAVPKTGEYTVLGWDAAGVVEAVGSAVSMFKPGDKVWYAGAIDRPGSNAELQAVDERIVAKMPQSLSFGHAAAMPLTAITAWELLFDRFKLDSRSEGALLVIGGAGGVGSMVIQLAKKLTALTVIATASRPESQKWVRELGADHTINHQQNLALQLRELGFESVPYILALTQTEKHLAAMADVIAPQGAIGVIDDPASLDIVPFKRKSVAFHWELMFTRSLFQTADMIAQHKLLAEVAGLVDRGSLMSTLQYRFGTINAANLLRAHQQLESGTTIGKIVLEGFEP